jgi:uncharacterized protein DUF29
MKNWQELSATSHYQTAVAVEEALERGDVGDAREGIQELIDALSRAERRALRSQLTRLMAHVIKWRSQPEKRSRSWRLTILQARREIEDIQEETPSLNRSVIESLWQKCLDAAKEDAETETGKPSQVAKLTWKEVFEKDYEL